MDEVPEPTKTDEAKGSAGLQMTVAAIVISAFLFAGKAAGYVRDMIISGYFGGSAASDAFYMIYNNIVVMVYTKVEKLLRPTYLPQFVKKLKDDEPGAWRIASIMTNIQLAALLVIVVLLEVFAGQLVRRLWPNLSSDPASFTLTVGLLRIMVPALLLYSVSVMPELTLHSYKRFTVPALADCVNRVVMVALLFVGLEYLWHPDDPHAMYAAGVGVLVAYPLRFLVQLPALWAKLRHYVVSLDMSNPGVRTIFRLMPAVVVGILASAGRGLADSIYADQVGQGIYTCLTFGRKMADAPLQILPLAVSFVVYPYLSQWAAEGARDKLADSLVAMTRAMAFIFVPATVAIMLLAKVIIAVMFEHGEFGPESTQLAGIALFCYALGIMAYSVEGSINKWYFALEDTRTPNYLGAAMALLHIVLGYIGVFIISKGSGAGGVANLGALEVGIAAIALALTISKTAKVVILYGLLLKHIGRIDKGKVYQFIGKLAFSTAVMGVVMWVLLDFVREPIMAWEPPFGGKKVQMLLLFGIVGGGGTATYLVAAAAVRIEEFGAVWQHLAGKVKKRLGR